MGEFIHGGNHSNQKVSLPDHMPVLWLWQDSGGTLVDSMIGDPCRTQEMGVGVSRKKGKVLSRHTTDVHSGYQLLFHVMEQWFTRGEPWTPGLLQDLGRVSKKS